MTAGACSGGAGEITQNRRSRYMQEIRKGMFARSLAGHDAGKLYVVWETDQQYLYLTDGRLRKTDNPKKKKKKHIQVDYTVAPVISDRISSGREIRDEDIRKAIRCKNKGGEE